MLNSRLLIRLSALRHSVSVGWGMVAQVGEHRPKIGRAGRRVEERVPIPPMTGREGLELADGLGIADEVVGEVGAHRALGVSLQDQFGDVIPPRG